MKAPILLLSLIIVVTTPLLGMATPQKPLKPTPKIGLALAGGGALGFAHIGVLKVLHEARIPLSAVAGTSMGSIVGAAYASGATLQEIEEVLTTTDWDKLFADGPRREDIPTKDKVGRNRELLGDGKFGIVSGKLVLPTGILEGQKIRPLLQRLFHRYPVACSFDSLAIPYRSVAADIETGKPVVIDHGDLALATRASMAVPGVFAPVELDEQLLVDGGIANNLPIDVVQGLGAQHVIAVELYADLQKRETLTNPLAISGQMLSLLLAQNAAIQRTRLTKNDILIEPKLSGFSATSFNKATELVALGEAAARLQLPQLARFSLSPEAYEAYEKERTRTKETSDIQFVSVKNETSIPDEVIMDRLELRKGDSFHSPSVQRSVEQVFTLGAFSSVSTEQVEKEGKRGLEITTKEKPWYPQYLRFGLGLEEDFRGDSFYNFAAGLRTNDVGLHGGFSDLNLRLGRINSLGAEFQDPIMKASNFYYALDGFTDRRSIFLRSGDDLIAEYRRRRSQGGIAVGYGYYESYDLRLGVRRGLGEVVRRVGSPQFTDSEFDVGDLYSSLAYDTLDDVDFPESGTLIRGGVSRSLDTLGSSQDFTEFSGVLTQPIDLGGISFVYKGEGSFTDGQRPIGRAFSLGGFLDLSGYTQNSLVATSYHIHRLVVLNRLDEGTSLLGYKLFLGGSVEVSSLRSSFAPLPDLGVLASGSLFLGVDTPLLPLYLGVGTAEGGNQSVYLVVGRTTSGAQRFDGG